LKSLDYLLPGKVGVRTLKMASKEKEELSYTYTDREFVILGQNQQYIEELICPVCLGCEVVVEREQLEKHSEASKDEHLRLAMEKVMELSYRMEEMETTTRCGCQTKLLSTHRHGNAETGRKQFRK
jgi:hypothetical protein